MYPTAAGVYPKDVSKSEVFSQSVVKNLDRDGDEAPASFAYSLSGAASTDFVIICHIDIEYELSLERLEGPRTESFLVARSRVVHRPDLEATRVQTDNLLFEFFRIRKGVISDIDVALESEGEFTVCEESRRRMLMVQPREDRFERIESLVEGHHNFRGGYVVLDLHCHGVLRRTKAEWREDGGGRQAGT